MNREEVLAFLSSQKKSFLNQFKVTKLGLFGSLARAEKANDIDVILEFEPNTENLFEKKLEIQDILQKRFQTKVDICREKFIKSNVKKIILRDAVFV